MYDSAIAVRDLSKRYLIGHSVAPGGTYRYTALRDVISREVRNFVRKSADLVRGRQVVHGAEVEEFWALKNVSFDVNQGEVLGVIGRNGAGKSTLLKILSRITEPTEGRILLSGRVASLLEVGTGFHPELTGRENIFLNGAILGMTQREIRRKFDEIVAFAEIEKFLDTPVKHYSSGMYVRLAFAVAAHLEPEILLVDEVLAVGDSAFQKKSLGKMDEISRKQGRTVLLVSHSMETVLRLCTRAIHIDSGHVRAFGNAKPIVAAYLQSQSSSPRVVDLSNKSRVNPPGGKARLAHVSPSDENTGWSLPFGQPLSLDLSVEVQPSLNQVELAVAIFTAGGSDLASWTNKCSGVELLVRPGINTFRVEFRHLRLLPGRYSLALAVRDDRTSGDYLPEAVLFEVTSSAEAADINAEAFPGSLVLSATVTHID
jgi:lipopolysaccharide transport system ATP-binding protein